MQHKKQETIDLLIELIDRLNDEYKRSPTNAELCKESGLGAATVSRYLNYMSEQGIIEYEPKHRIAVISDTNTDHLRIECVNLALAGAIPCGTPEDAEATIEKYVPVPTMLLGNGEYFLLRTSGFSMINAGIEPDDIVLVRKSVDANIGDIVAAITEDNETTLKRLAWDDDEHRYYLMPENDDYEPIYDNFSIQGVVEKIIKDVT